MSDVPGQIEMERRIAVNRLVVSVDGAGMSRPDLIGREAVDRLARIALDRHAMAQEGARLLKHMTTRAEAAEDRAKTIEDLSADCIRIQAEAADAERAGARKLYEAVVARSRAICGRCEPKVSTFQVAEEFDKLFPPRPEVT